MLPSEELSDLQYAWRIQKRNIVIADATFSLIFFQTILVHFLYFDLKCNNKK